MDKLLDKVWDLFGTNVFKEISHKKIEELDRDESISLSCAKLASGIYNDDYDLMTTSSRFNHDCKKYDHDLKVDIIQNKNIEDKNAVVIIRGTKTFSNWVLNMNAGWKFIVVVLIKLVTWLGCTCFFINFFINLSDKRELITFCSKLDVFSILIEGVNIFFVNELYREVFAGTLLATLCTLLVSVIVQLLMNWSRLEVVHSGYNKVALAINEDIKNIKPKKVIVIGHSLGGGIGEELVRINHGTVRGVLFNKATSRIGYTSHNDMRRYVFDYRLLFDILTIVTFVFFMPILNAANLYSKRAGFIEWLNKIWLIGSFIASVIIEVLIQYFGINDSSVVMNIYKFALLLSLALLLKLFFDTLFVGNHKMKEIIKELE